MESKHPIESCCLGLEAHPLLLGGEDGKGTPEILDHNSACDWNRRVALRDAAALVPLSRLQNDRNLPWTNENIAASFRK